MKSGWKSKGAVGRTSKTWMSLALTLAAFAWLAPRAHASLVEALDLPALVERSDDVVVARVVASKSLFDEHGRIVTDTTMQVEQTEKGEKAPGAMVVVRSLGGHVGDLGMRVEGEPSFDTGETVLVFGRRIKQLQTLRLVGMSQGALRIESREGVRWVKSMPVGAALVTDGNLRRGQAAVVEARKLDDVLGEIRTLVNKAK